MVVPIQDNIHKFPSRNHSKGYIGLGNAILTTDHGKDLEHRKGAKTFWVAVDVIIVSAVVIDAKAVIYPGVKIGERRNG